MFAYFIGPLPFCLRPAASPSEVGPGTLFPLTTDQLATITLWFWRVRRWRLSLTGLANPLARFPDYTEEFAHHERPDGSIPASFSDLSCRFGLDLRRRIQLFDPVTESALDIELELRAFRTGRRAPGPLFATDFFVRLDTIFPPGITPPTDPIARSTLGGAIAGELRVHQHPFPVPAGPAAAILTAPLYTNFSGQQIPDWQVDLTLEPVEEWTF